MGQATLITVDDTDIADDTNIADGEIAACALVIASVAAFAATLMPEALAKLTIEAAAPVGMVNAWLPAGHVGQAIEIVVIDGAGGVAIV